MPAKASDKSTEPSKPEDAPHYLGHRERLRERFYSAGADALSDYELLEMALFPALPRRDTKPLAKTLIKTFGSFAEVVHAPVARLREVEGMGEAAIHQVKLIAAASHRVAKGEVNSRNALSSWNEVIDYCRSSMAFADKEQFRLLFLDKRNQLIADEVQQTGTVDHTPVYPREVIKRALDDLARIDRGVVDGAGLLHFVRDQLVALVEEQQAKLLLVGERHAGPDIVDHVVPGRQGDASLDLAFGHPVRCRAKQLDLVDRGFADAFDLAQP